MFRAIAFRLLLCFLLGPAFGQAAEAARGPFASNGESIDPFSVSSGVRVFLFLRTDCPITNRYAPELHRIAAEFRNAPVTFWLVYPDALETVHSIEEHIRQYGLPGAPLRDPSHSLVARARATVSPEAAVFDRENRLTYIGRVDDRWIDFGKSRPAPTVHDLENAIKDTLAGRAPRQRETRAIGCSLADLH